MASSASITAADLLELLRVPNVSAYGLARLGRAVLRALPEGMAAMVEAVAAELELSVERIEAALADRLRELNVESQVSEADFDRAVDGLWGDLSHQLLRWERYTHRGLGALSDKLEQEAELDEPADRARRGRAMHERLFGASGLEFRGLPFLEQAGAMAAILRIIDEDELTEEIDELAGPEPLQALRACQQRYEEMTEARLVRERGYAANLNELRAELREQISRYNAVVYASTDPEDPESLARAWAALRPVKALREQLASARSEAELDYEEIEGEGEGAEAELAEAEVAEE